MRFTGITARLLSFLQMEGGMVGFHALFFIILLYLLSIPLWAVGQTAEKPVSFEETAKTVADASKSDRERVNAASLLAESDDPKAIEPLFAAISNFNEKPLLRAAMIHGLSKSPQKAPVSDFLAGRLKDLKEESEVRAAAASVLGSIGLPMSKKPLGRAVSDQNPMVRQAARQALIGLDGEGIDRAGLLIATLQDTEQRALVRAQAARQLGELRDMRALQPLILALREKSPNIPHPQTPKDFFVARSLAKEHLPASAARALGHLGSHAAASPLLSMTDTPDNEFRTAIFEALAMLKTPEAVPAAAKAILSDSDHRVRRWAGVIMKDLANKDMLPILLKALKDADPGVRLQVVQAIGKIGECKTIKELKEALGKEENSQVREVIDDAVRIIKGSNSSCEVEIK